MKLFVSYQNAKFIKNIISTSINGLDILSSPYKGLLYKIHQQNHIGAYIFDSRDVDKEVLQFINDYKNKIKFFIYHENQPNVQLIENLSICKHLIHNGMQDNDERVIKIPILVNTQLFTKNNKQTKYNDSIICFLDNYTQVPENLLSLLYPNTTLKIKMYGGQFKHPQNLGMVSEQDKADLLNKHQSYLSIDKLYDQEALLCDCDIYTVNSILDNQTINKDLSIGYVSYDEFLTNILI
jgi:hypothetical protein